MAKSNEEMELLDDRPRASAKEAGYMELDGAKKDGDCAIVEVEGGVSRDLGCCNLVKPTVGAKKFTCGLCEYVRE